MQCFHKANVAIITATPIVTSIVAAVLDLVAAAAVAAVAAAVDAHAIIAAKKMRIHAISMVTANILKIAIVAPDNL
ncbi:MAG: hypothetical protein RSD67_04990 [Oscillospiraceae bacterium]